MQTVLLDTNILVSAYDPRFPSKQRRAIEVLNILRNKRSGVLTAQILSEFYVVATRKLTPPLTPVQAESQLRIFAQQWSVLSITQDIVFLAASGARAYHMHFWDAQVWAAARLHGISHIYSEDCNPEAVVEGVCFENPLT